METMNTTREKVDMITERIDDQCESLHNIVGHILNFADAVDEFLRTSTYSISLHGSKEITENI